MCKQFRCSMALSTRLVLRQGQSLVMTPQLLQAIKLLQFSNMELSAFVEEELERNPLLERADDRPDEDLSFARAVDSDQWSGEAQSESDFQGFDDSGSFSPDEAVAFSDGDGPDYSTSAESAPVDWTSDQFAVEPGALAADLGTDLSNAFDADRAVTPGEAVFDGEGAGLSATSWSGSGAGGVGGESEAHNLEAYVAAQVTLRDHLSEQLAVAVSSPVDRMIGHAIIDSIDEAGYFVDSVEETAARLGTSDAQTLAVLKIVQTFDPSGVGARNLAECLTLQLQEQGRFDPAMEALLANLPLLARRDFPALRRLCGVDQEDMIEMVAEVRRLDPKPGRAFGVGVIQPVVPDVLVRAASDGSWQVELNPDCLPRVLVNQTYAHRISRTKGSAADRSFVANCLQTANWLTKSLDQRARTILKVATEIVRQQDAFFEHGVGHLRPLNLKTIADAIGMHESTVSRVTSNKYMASPRGLFELKYFFTASIQSSSGGETHSAESVRWRIKQLIDLEEPQTVLSDDALVSKLKEANVDIARRTVAKYRESLKIPSSVERRREKMAMLQAAQ